MENQSLSEALASTETATAETTPATSGETTVTATDQSAADSSLQTNESVEAKTETTEDHPDEAGDTVDKVREWGKNWQSSFKAKSTEYDDLNGRYESAQSLLTNLGGESQLKIMAPLLEKAREIPRSPQEVESWSEGMWGSMKQSMLPTQVEGLRAEAAWSYINDPVGVRQITQALYGAEGQQLPANLPDVIKEFVAAYVADPTVIDVLRPEESPEQRLQRQQWEASLKERDERDRLRNEQFQKMETESHQRIAQQTMSQVLTVGLGGRAEVKKQFGLEFHENGDTPEMAAFNRRLSDRYDRIVTQALMSDSQLSQLCNSAEYLAGQKDDTQRKRAMDQYGPEIKQRVTKLCTDIAKDLAEDRKFLDPAYSDRAKAANLKDLPAQIGGGTGGTVSQPALAGMPDPIGNPMGFQKWLEQQYAAQPRGPAILTAG